MSILHLLHGKPMIDFEHMKWLFEFLKFAHVPKKHRTNFSEWDITTMHNVVLNQMTFFVQKTIFVSISCDEI
jgi:hypothetical protein